MDYSPIHHVHTSATSITDRKTARNNSPGYTALASSFSPSLAIAAAVATATAARFPERETVRAIYNA